MSKVLKGSFISKIDTFMTTAKFLSYLYGFRTSLNAQYSLLNIIGINKTFGERRQNKGIPLKLSKAFDTINNKLLLAKLDGYGFFRTSLKLMQNYFCNRHQRSFINGSF